MKHYVTLWKIDHVSENGKLPECNRHFEIPTVLFSAGGYTGNHFHDFTDTIIPLYLTARQFNRTVIFLITDKRNSWFQKYKLVLDKLSNYDTIDVDKENKVLCFARTVVGLRSHKEFGIDPLQPPHYSMRQFRHFLRSTFSLHRDSITSRTCSKRPRMLVISRKDNRFITNEDEVADKSRGLGFDVVVQETGWNMSETTEQVNSFDVMLGVHGAGLTNMVFLPENGVVVQIIPFGADLWAKPYFGTPAKDMGLRYLEYRVSLNESSLLGRYPVDSEVYRDPGAIYKKGFVEYHSVYLNNQDVTLDFDRLRRTLVKAFELVRC
ncbi:protein o-linked-mannose beta-1 4-n-acetylglucosaminyltransferase 2 [Phtheirospermum japonicum]|uniref:Protein o-linked-mannose beta-1 4-n-acetylglucosaminyltransferase 2 n=1 Tax=Phtheirospermum japonicum TaxID=374723 RepID=A0A830BMR6_9LAMI|nr:protein o-linked-mannose beta-1 4-n-acetylglucosaminyltransferase 2 [Phtheirospermum japonicum]